MIAVYADTAHPLGNVNRQLLDFIGVFELHGSGRVFSHFESLQLTSWQHDSLRGNVYIPLPRWIQAKRAVVNVTSTGVDCFKWAVSAGVYPVDVNAYCMGQYAEHRVSTIFLLYTFLSLFLLWFFRISKQHVWCGRRQRGNISSPCFVNTCSERHVDLLLFERGSVHHYTTIRNFSRLVSSQLNTNEHVTYCCRQCLHSQSSQELLDAHAIDCSPVQTPEFPERSIHQLSEITVSAVCGIR